MRKLSLLLAVIGLFVSIGLVAWYGFNGVVAAVASAGWRGFAIIVAWQMALFGVLGLAWDVILPSEGLRRRMWVPVWGRMVRDCAANILPFSQVGGFIFGARAVTLHGIEWPVATASTVVDVTAEFLAELAFVAIGLGILLARAPSSDLAVPVEVGLGLAVCATFAFIWIQRGAAPLFARMGRRIAGRWFRNAKDRMDVVQAEFGLIYGHTLRLALGFSIHLLGWIGTGIAGWIAYRVIGVPIDFDDALAIEALLAGAAAVGFLVPVNAGVQEAGYAALGSIFGVPPELSLGVSLIRRARDVTIGVPILLLWQMLEARRLGGQRVTPPA
ncbi:MAG TPA: lysylphosphatidylglycerol synthase domain-containing protein [Acetobacteraceae bacterium]|nr:lysylphosphatidylglycerol synthase domain-containing protein [Acetobacteraceae bacterium]